MKQNAATFRHPKALRAIRFALWLAKLEAYKKAKAGGYGFAKQYVQNRKGQNYLRLDCILDSTGYTMRAWGDQSRDVTTLVLNALNNQKKGK